MSAPTLASIPSTHGKAPAVGTPGIIIGVDTHKHAHVAVALNELGVSLGACRAAATTDGYRALLTWAHALGPLRAFAVEGTGSYGAGLASFLRRHAVQTVEVSGMTNRHRLFRGGHRQANAAIHRVAMVRRRWHAPTMTYVARRTAEGLTKRDILRCLKRFVAREIYRALLSDFRARVTANGVPEVRTAYSRRIGASTRWPRRSSASSRRR